MVANYARGGLRKEEGRICHRYDCLCSKDFFHQGFCLSNKVWSMSVTHCAVETLMHEYSYVSLWLGISAGMQCFWLLAVCHWFRVSCSEYFNLREWGQWGQLKSRIVVVFEKKVQPVVFWGDRRGGVGWFCDGGYWSPSFWYRCCSRVVEFSVACCFSAALLCKGFSL